MENYSSLRFHWHCVRSHFRDAVTFIHDKLPIAIGRSAAIHGMGIRLL